MLEFEYKIFKLDDSVPIPRLKEIMDEWGKDGWDNYFIQGDFFYFKKKKENPIRLLDRKK